MVSEPDTERCASKEVESRRGGDTRWYASKDARSRRGWIGDPTSIEGNEYREYWTPEGDGL